MECPRCKAELMLERYKGIEVDRCTSCEGLWLDHPELDDLEDNVLDQDESKGMMIYASRPSDIACPKCAGSMHTFNYRAYNLPLDVCDSQHGFWLDKGEEKRVLELMDTRIKDLSRSAKAEAQWGALLRTIKSKSFGQRFKGLFR